MKLFGRTARVELFQWRSNDPVPTVSSASRYQNILGIWEFPNLVFQFSIPFADQASASNLATLEMTNLSKENETKFRKERHLRIYAGYGNNPPLVFGSAIIDGVGSRDTEVDQILVVRLSDESTKWLEMTTALQWSEKVKTSDIVFKLIEALKMEVGVVDPGLDKEYERGFTVHQDKKIKDWLDLLAKDSLSKVYVYQGYVYFVRPPYIHLPVFSIGNQQGVWPLIGSLEEVEDDITSTQHDPRWKATTLITPEIRPDRAVFITSDTYTGLGRVIGANHEFSIERAVTTFTFEPMSDAQKQYVRSSGRATKPSISTPSVSSQANQILTRDETIISTPSIGGIAGQR